MPETVRKLAELFTKLPGVGPRQARRFVHYILSRDKEYANELIKGIEKISAQISQCSECYRYFDHQSKFDKCSICRGPNIDKTKLVVVEKDADLDVLQKTDLHPRFFVLGGLIPLSESDYPYIRLTQLISKVRDLARDDLEEVIIAFSASPEGDHTTEILREKLGNILSINELKVTKLGRGLSTGTELEYSDVATIVEALKNRV